jgi:hypothetical protein
MMPLNNIDIPTGNNGEKDVNDHHKNAEVLRNVRNQIKGQAANDAPALQPRSIWGSLLDQPLPARAFVYGKMLQKGKVSVLGGAGGIGKSQFALMMISMAIGIDLLGRHVETLKRRRVLLLNNEDDDGELNLRVTAICKRCNIDPAELDGWLHVLSGYENPIKLAQITDGQGIKPSETVQELERLISDKSIEVVSIDPLVSIHCSNENDNGEMDAVVGIIKGLAGRCHIAVQVLHHIKKGAEPSNGDEALRGASALKDAARTVHLLAPMPENVHITTNITKEDARRYITLCAGKANYALPNSELCAFKMVTVDILAVNEDQDLITEQVGVPEPVDLKFISTEHTSRKWTPVSVAEAFDPILSGLKSPQRSNDVKQQIAAALNLSESMVGRMIKLLPCKGTRKNGGQKFVTIRPDGQHYIHYWTERDGDGNKAPYRIFREKTMKNGFLVHCASDH